MNNLQIIKHENILMVDSRQVAEMKGGENMSEQTLEQRVSTLEKEIAELKVQVSERPRMDIHAIATELEFYRSKALHKTE